MNELRYKGHIPGLDALRGIAIGLVLLYHGLDGRVPWQNASGMERWILYLTSWGTTGVHLFFVLSGFLITGIILDGSAKKDFYRHFYFNRAMRILPAYFAILAVLKLDHIISWRYVLACVLYAANMAKLFGAHNSEYGAFWSLAVEEQFYLLWPSIARRLSLKTLSKTIVVYCGVSLIMRGLAYRYLPGMDVGYKLWGNADWLLLGALVAVSLRAGYLHQRNIRAWICRLVGLGTATLPIPVYLDLMGTRTSWQTELLLPFYRVPVVLIYMAMLLYVVLCHSRDNGELHKGVIFRFLVFLGYVSYGLYLVHPFVYSRIDGWCNGTWLGNVITSPLSLIASFSINVAASIAVAFVSRRYFEEVFLRFKSKASKPIPTDSRTLT